jgi:hypothetical protein
MMRTQTDVRGMALTPVAVTAATAPLEIIQCVHTHLRHLAPSLPHRHQAAHRRRFLGL